jgi:beta-N-acetylhexosaminidase
VLAALAALALAVPAAAPERPSIAWTPIPYPARRRAEMEAYARRHYGLNRFRLVRPRVIVQHMTEGATFRSAFDTFAPDVPDGELGELPGVCAHFVIDRDGTIHQLVPLGLMCRHTVGLNYTSIGIEHVGVGDQALMGNARQLAASLRLTRWLQGRLRIATRNVIGHNESLTSAYHRERVARLRTQTHGDWPAAVMRTYRAALARISCSP